METLALGLMTLVVVEFLALIVLSVIIKKKSSEKAKRRPEQYVIFMIYLIIFTIAGYFFYANLDPDNVINNFGDYQISAGDIGLTSELRSLHLDKDYVFGGETKINDKTARLIISEEPFNIVFNPKTAISENTPAELELSFIKLDTEVYLDDKLIIPNLEGYTKVQDFFDTEVWVKRDLIPQRDDSGEPLDKYKTSNTAENFIYINFPQNSIYSFAESNGGAPIIQDYTQETTRISTQFRDNLKLAVYADDYLDIRFTKQDLNNYVGSDEYTVEIKDFQGETHFIKTYEDDGEKKDIKVEGDGEDFRIRLYDLPRNVYYITFTKDKNNKASDSTIRGISINSNKVLILDKSLPLDEFEFYTKVDAEKTIGFKYWWTSKNQTITQTGIIKDTINLDEDWLSEKYEQELTEKGDYNFEIEIGVVWVYADVISPSKENWFYFPQVYDKTLINSDIIIIDKNKLSIDGDEVTYIGQVEVNENSKFKVQVLDETRIYFSKAKLELKP